MTFRTTHTNRSRPSRRTGASGVIALAAMLLMSAGAFGLAACGGDDEPASRASNAAAQPRERAQATDAGRDRTFVGKLEGTDASIAVNVSEDFAHAYVCDSKRIWGLLSGAVRNGRLKLSSKTGQALVGTIAGETVRGSVTLKDGTKRSFTASPATGDAGLYQLAKEVDGTRYVTRWVRTNDGSVRGKTTTQLTSQPADAETAVEATDGAGSESVPPDASQPEARGLLDRFRCSRAKSKYNKLVKTLNDRGGASAATNEELNTVIHLGDEVNKHCGFGTEQSDAVGTLQP